MRILLIFIVIGAVAAVAVAAVVHNQSRKRAAAAWCLEHGYGNYATKDEFCVGPKGKLIKITGPERATNG